jgi:hypothetical protein
MRQKEKNHNPNTAGGTHPPDPVINIAQPVKTGDKPGGDHAPGRWRALVATKPYLSPGLSLDCNLLPFSSLVYRKDGRAKLDRGPGAEPAKGEDEPQKNVHFRHLNGPRFVRS